MRWVMYALKFVRQPVNDLGWELGVLLTAWTQQIYENINIFIYEEY